jgi:hypothetical protein
MRVGFFAGSLQFRGVHVAIFDYALHNQLILGNESIVFYDEQNPGSDGVLQKFRDYFQVIPYPQFSDLNLLAERAKIDAMYLLKAGNKDGKIVDSCPSLIHAVFPQKISEQHGLSYAYISKWLSKKYSLSKIPVVEHMITLPDTDLHLRESLSIPNTAKVFGYYGGHDSFNIDFVIKTISELADSHRDYYFIFMNVDKFIDHVQIKFLPGTSDFYEKVKFINTTDAMIHAREMGESFGIACGEFSIKNKPIFAYAYPHHRNHLDILGDKALLYRDAKDLKRMLVEFDPKWAAKQNWNCYFDQYSPGVIMKQFKEVFLTPVENKQDSLVVFDLKDKIHLGSQRLINKFLHSRA